MTTKAGGSIAADMPEVPGPSPEQAAAAAQRAGEQQVLERQEAAILIGGEWHPVQLMGTPTEPAEKVDVMVRLLGALQYERFLEVYADEAELIGFCCGKPSAWVNRLTGPSVAALAEAARDLNFSSAWAWSERTMAAAARLAGEGLQRARKALPSSAPAPGT